MKNINFIKTIPPKEQVAIYRWFLVSTFLLITTIMGILIVQIPQLYTLWTLKHEKKKLNKSTTQFEKTLATKHQLTKEKQVLKNQIKKINHLQERNKRPLSYLQAIDRACNSNVRLKSLTVDKQLQLTAQCNNIKQATTVIENLTESNAFHNLTITNLQQNEAGLTVTIKGMVKKITS